MSELSERTAPVPEQGDRLPGLPDDVFVNDGLLTKRHVRATAFAFLRPRPGELLWDVGAGSGAVGIEWCRSGEGNRALGIERDPLRVERARDNAARLGCGDALTIVAGELPGALSGLETPDAVFVGGGATVATVDTCWDALGPGGRLVVHAVTLETEAVVAERYRRLGGSLTRIGVEHVQTIGNFLAWTPARAIVQWAVTKD
ncbi:precorrin-6Y C5,15-methyltransferase (decarboxylating) subunit CbiT [Nigerium massiliense]|uniref:precorrin-6Y C5,15-methyltransferase (decarboxylating) subunit CbiT n=1 Tax=Nigerium massiliense TaxID=1522317 RepID=UPI000694C250|nr:precorrin-6Y C5,15-methyltransferase (decarboxylating) subunit CbiT [Nigerium massiliense]